MHFSSLLSFAFLALSAVADDSVLLQFNPESILVMDTAVASFSVKMLHPPSSRAATTVAFQQPGFQFSKCQLTFTRLNYNVSQTVEIVAAPSFSKKNVAVDIVASICAPDTKYTYLEQRYTVKPKQFPGKTCKSTGDPHYKSFDGEKFNFYEEGSYYMLQSEQLNVQANLIDFKYGKRKRSWNNKFAIRYGSTAYVAVLNGTVLQVSRVSPTADENELEGKNYEFIIGDGTGKVSIFAKGGKNRQRIDIVLTLCPDLYPEATGLCMGDKNQCPAEDDMFAGNCRIPQVKFGRNLSKCRKDPVCKEYVEEVVTLVVQEPEIYKPALKPGCRRVIIDQAYDPKLVVEKVTESPEYEPEVVDYKVAEERCEALIQDQKISDVDRSFYVKSCAFDYAEFGDINDAEQYRETYNGDCGVVLDFLSQSPYEDERENAAKLANETGLGLEGYCHKDQCGSQGYCSGNGCSCNEGFMGDQCQYNVETPEQIQQAGSGAGKISFLASLATVGFLLV